jgi:plasmid stabilization system protein ParE
VKHRLLVRKQAELELHQAAIWYERQNAGLGAELLDEIRETLQLIREQPESFPIDYRYARRALSGRFPYAVHFVVKDDLISVIAVLRTSQDKEGKLRDRLSP